MNLSTTKTRIRRGFTLIELLFVIAIIAVLSTMALGVMRSAQNDAKESATLSRISQIESILLVELEDYEVRRLPVAVAILATAANTASTSLYPDGDGDGIFDNLGVQVRNLRRRILQDIINAEIPRPLIRVDVSNVPIRDADGNLTFEFNPDLGVFPTTQRAGTGSIGFTTWLDNSYPGLSGFLSGLRSSRVRAWANFVATMHPTDTMALNYYEKFDLPGEYLYQTLANMDFDGAPAIEVLGNQAIGNSDGDAFLEVVDAWGEPFQLRIWQVNAVQVEGAPGSTAPRTAGVTDVWKDKSPDVNPIFPEIDFDIKDPDGVPQGYSVLDPTVPREVSKIRFEVISTRLPF